MYVGKTLFAQVMEIVPWTSFARIVQRRGGTRACGRCRVPSSSARWPSRS